MLVCSWQWTLCFWHILSGNVQSQDIRYFRSTDMWLMWWKNVIQKEPEIQINHPFPLWLWNVKIFKPWSFPGRKKQTRWKFCGGVGWGAICEGLKETNVTRSTDLSMASGYCMSKDLRNCSTFRTPKTFGKETSIHPKVVWKKTLGEAQCLYLPRCHVLLSETAKGSTDGCRIQSLPSLLVSTRWTRTTCPA